MKQIIFLFALVLTIITTTPQSALAFDARDAQRLTTDISQTISRSSGRNTEHLRSEFERIFNQKADTAYIAAYVLGVDYRRATSEQRRDFEKALVPYLSDKYAGYFSDLNGITFDINKIIKRQGNDGEFEVDTTATFPKKSPINIRFFVTDRTGTAKLTNLRVDGINLLLSERRNIGNLIDRNGGDLDKMISHLQRKSNS